MPTSDEVTLFVNHYIQAIEFTERDDDNAHILSEGFYRKCRQDCIAFLLQNYSTIVNAPAMPYGNIPQAAHDFWMTRTGQGCGFWDGDWPEDLGETLTKSAQSFGNCETYVGDDGLLYA
jgi:hypothetical protein